jgi:hypothetical protein
LSLQFFDRAKHRAVAEHFAAQAMRQRAQEGIAIDRHRR